MEAHDCTSTTRCNGVDVGVPGKQRFCVDVFCTPWVPYCLSVAVWFESYSPTYSETLCSPVILPG